MWDRVLENYSCALEFGPECYEAQQIDDKIVDTHPSTILVVPECYKTQELCYKTVHRCFLYLILFLINTKLKKYVP